MARIVVVGEAWGEHEEAARRPFVGPSGRLLWGMLSQVGISRDDCFVTNVFNLRPRPTNDVSNLCGSKADGIPNMKPLSQGKYVLAKYEPELHRLWDEIRRESPNLILALGATAVWALVRGQNSIKKTRGYVHESHLGPKVLPTYHPAAMLRQWSLRPIIIADLSKAKREAEFPDIRRPRRELWIEPTLDDLWEFYASYIILSELVSADIETAGNQITEIGFAPDPQHAIVVPFVCRAQPDGNYWRTFEEERQAWRFVKKVCEEHTLVGQNFNYDMNYLLRYYGISCRFAEHDTMLLHHSLQPELEKSLAFMGSTQTDEPSWKFMRSDHTTLKAEDE